MMWHVNAFSWLLLNLLEAQGVPRGALGSWVTRRETGQWEFSPRVEEWRIAAVSPCAPGRI